MESYPFTFNFRSKNLRLRSKEDIVPLSYQIEYMLKTENKIILDWGDKWFSKKSKSQEAIDAFENSCLSKWFKKRTEFFSTHYSNYIGKPRKMEFEQNTQNLNIS